MTRDNLLALANLMAAFGGGAVLGKGQKNPAEIKFAHRRWELDDLARRLDEQQAAVELREGLVPAPVSSASGLSPDGRSMLEAIGVSAVTVKRRLSRGMRLLTEQLADLCPGERPPDAIQVHTGRKWVL
jgi:hypothetical protein